MRLIIGIIACAVMTSGGFARDATNDAAGTVTGRVLSTDGTPLTDRAVLWAVKIPSLYGIGYSGSTCTDGQGRYQLDDMPLDSSFALFTMPTVACGSATPSEFPKEYQEGRRLFFTDETRALQADFVLDERYGTFSGRVIHEDGTILNYSIIEILDADTMQYVGITIYTAPDRYTSIPLAPGDYIAWNRAAARETEYRRVTVTAGMDTPNIDWTLPAANHPIPLPGIVVRGRILQPDGIQPSIGYPSMTIRRIIDVRGGVWQTVWQWASYGVQVGYSSGDFTAYLPTPSTYLIDVLAHNYAPTTYGADPAHRQGTPIVANTADLTGIDIILSNPNPARFAVSGTLTDALTGMPLSGWVTFSTTDGVQTGGDFVDRYGQYSVLVPAGTYTAFATGNYAAKRYYGNATALAEARTFTVTDAPVTGIDIALGRLGEISGRLTNAQGDPVPNRLVFAHPVGLPETYSNSCSSEGGYYSVQTAHIDLPNIVYVSGECLPSTTPVGTNNPIDTTQRYGGIYWGGSPTREGAATLSITMARPFATDIDLTLPVGGSLSGRVVDAATGTPLQGTVSANLVEEGIPLGWLGPSSGAETTTDGSYQINGLVSGRYLLLVYPDDHAYQNTFYPAAISHEDAVPITIAPDADTGIDFALSRIPDPPRVTVALDLQGRPPKPHPGWVVNAHVRVTPIGEDVPFYDADVTSDDNGQVVIASLPTGEFTIALT
ncbi:MAG: carboxypeptidase-like regulatory domain-containing protein, partial [Chloroflexota bacterium]|nr:carboxypeptidase-like regulatory domain-containing protein [Chloroflexota bacterium]